MFGDREGSQRMEIVALAIVEHQGRILIARRRSEGSFPGKWELPGGKCKPGEDSRNCVIREVREETGLEVAPEPEPAVSVHRYSHLTVEFHTYFCRDFRGEARPLSSDELLWVPWDRLDEYAFPEANTQIFRDAMVRRAGNWTAE